MRLKHNRSVANAFNYVLSNPSPSSIKSIHRLVQDWAKAHLNPAERNVAQRPYNHSQAQLSQPLQITEIDSAQQISRPGLKSSGV